MLCHGQRDLPSVVWSLSCLWPRRRRPGPLQPPEGTCTAVSLSGKPRPRGVSHCWSWAWPQCQGGPSPGPRKEQGPEFILESSPSSFGLEVRAQLDGCPQPSARPGSRRHTGIPGQAQKTGQLAQRPRGAFLSPPEPRWAGLGGSGGRTGSPFLSALAPAALHPPPAPLQLWRGRAGDTVTFLLCSARTDHDILGLPLAPQSIQVGPMREGSCRCGALGGVPATRPG